MERKGQLEKLAFYACFIKGSIGLIRKRSKTIPNPRCSRVSDQDRNKAVNTMSYNGYYARVEFDPDDMIFVGRLAGINDVVGFHADNVADLRAAFERAVDDYIATCVKAEKQPEKPYSGKVMFRISPEVHAKAALAAQLAGKSLNQWAETVLRQAAEKIAR